MDEHTVHRQITIKNTQSLDKCAKMILRLSEQDLQLIRNQRKMMQVQWLLIVSFFILNAVLIYHIWAGH